MFKSQFIESHIGKILLLGLFAVFLSGDHLFNKVNSLKLAMVLVLLSSVFLAYLFVNKKQSSINLNKTLLFLLSPILVTSIGWLIANGEFSQVLPYELMGMLLPVVFCFLLVSLLNQNLINENQLSWALILILLYVVVVALIQTIGFGPLIKWLITPFEYVSSNEVSSYAGPVNRVASSFGNPNYFAGFLVLTIPLLVVQLNANKKTIPLYLLCFLSVVALLLSGSRAGLVAFFIAAVFQVVLLAVYHGMKLRNIILIALFFIITFAMVASQFSIFERLLQLGEHQSWVARLYIWEGAWNSILNAPIFGYGPGSSYALQFNFISPDHYLHGVSNSFRHAHNEILEVLQEGGLFGLFFYLAFWGYIFFIGLKVLFNTSVTSNSRLLILAVLTGLFAFHLHGLFSVAPRMISVRLIAYVYVAIIIALAIKEKAISPWFVSNNQQAIYSNVVVILIVALSFVWFIPYLNQQYHFIKYKQSNDQKYLENIKHSNDSYILDAFSVNALLQKNGPHLEELSKRQHNNFPHYRANDYFLAYSAYLNGQHDESMRLAKLAQKRDKYHRELNILLSKLAIQKGDQQLLEEQLSLLFNKLVCRNDIKGCGSTLVGIVQGAQPIGLNGDKFLIDRRLIDYVMSLNGEDEQVIRTVAPVLNKSVYFQPKGISAKKQKKLVRYLTLNGGSKMFSATYSKDLSFLKQVVLYFEQKAVFDQEQIKVNQELNSLKIGLEKSFAFDDYLRKRQLLIELSAWLADLSNI